MGRHDHTLIGDGRYTTDVTDRAGLGLCVVEVGDEGAFIDHSDPVAPHGTIALAPGRHEIRRQRDETPAGSRLVQD